jgi:hypothetical protein
MKGSELVSKIDLGLLEMGRKITVSGFQRSVHEVVHILFDITARMNVNITSVWEDLKVLGAGNAVSLTAGK